VVIREISQILNDEIAATFREISQILNDEIAATRHPITSRATPLLMES
jgi:hypothetical protein